MWRSLVARLHGVQEAAGSNPVIPTMTVTFGYYKEKDDLIIFFLIDLLHDS